MSDDPKETRLDGKLISLTDHEAVQSWCQALGCAEEQLNEAVNAVGHSAHNVREYLNQTIVLSPNERAELVSCLEEGAKARRADIDHGANPYLSSPVIPQGAATREDHLNILRVDAWWDGWEELQRHPGQVDLPFEWKPF